MTNYDKRMIIIGAVIFTAMIIVAVISMVQ